MKRASVLAFVFLPISLAVLACGLLTSTTVTPQVETDAGAKPSVEPGAEATAVPTLEATTATQTSMPTPVPTATVEKLQLEVVQSQAWTDRDGNARVNVLFRNPYDFPVAPAFRASANLIDGTGTFMRSQELYFLDGISGGGGFIMPGEIIAANGCFTCEKAPLTGEWGSIKFEAVIADASGKWDIYTDVEATIGSVTFDGDSPIFWVTGTVKNKTDATLSRISARVIVFDQKGNLVGAAEVSSWDVGPGASANFKGYGIGKSPGGAVKSEITALGVKY